MPASPWSCCWRSPSAGSGCGRSVPSTRTATPPRPPRWSRPPTRSSTACRPWAAAGGELRFRPGKWLTVLRLHGLAPVGGRERYLVFMRNYWGWVLAGAVHPDAAGDAELRSATEPRPPTIYEVVVTRGVDDATSVPHGEPVLHWYDPGIAPPKAGSFDFVRGA